MAVHSKPLVVIDSSLTPHHWEVVTKWGITRRRERDEPIPHDEAIEPCLGIIGCAVDDRSHFLLTEDRNEILVSVNKKLILRSRDDSETIEGNDSLGAQYTFHMGGCGLIRKGGYMEGLKEMGAERWFEGTDVIFITAGNEPIKQRSLNLTLPRVIAAYYKSFI